MGLLMGVAEEFRLTLPQALDTLRQMIHAVTHWGEVARDLGAPAEEIDRMSAAFEHEAAVDARALVGP